MPKSTIYGNHQRQHLTDYKRSIQEKGRDYNLRINKLLIAQRYSFKQEENEEDDLLPIEVVV